MEPIRMEDLGKELGECFLGECFDKKSNSHTAMVARVSTKYGELTEPWHIQALIKDQCDLTITVATPGGLATFTTKVKSAINMDYPDRGWFTLVVDVKIADEVMEAWLTDKFDEPGHKCLMFYPERRLARLNHEITCYQCETKDGCAYYKSEYPYKCPIFATSKAVDKNSDVFKVPEVKPTGVQASELMKQLTTIGEIIKANGFYDKKPEEGCPVTIESKRSIDAVCNRHKRTQGCAYDRHLGPEHCPILNDFKNGGLVAKGQATDAQGYLDPSPWTYLNELGAHVVMLSASCSDQPEIEAQCGHTLDLIVQLEHMLDVIPI